RADRRHGPITDRPVDVDLEPHGLAPGAELDSPYRGQRFDEQDSATHRRPVLRLLTYRDAHAPVVDLDADRRRLLEHPQLHPRTDVLDDVGDELRGEELDDLAGTVEAPGRDRLADEPADPPP